LKKILIILTILIAHVFGNVIEIDITTSKEILSSSKIYIDNTKKYDIEKIIKNDERFININEPIKRYGYSPNFNVWIKFTLHNLEDKPISKILEFDNPLVTDISFFENNKLIKLDGLLNKEFTRKSVNPIFKINLNKNETKTYYIKVSSKNTAMSLKLNLYLNDIFYSKEIFHQVILSLFFGAMIILALYNFLIFLMIKDISYLYYVGYIITLVFHQLLYVGFANLYFFDTLMMNKIVDFAAIFIAIPVLFLALFTKSFLETKQYLKLNIILNFLILMMILSVIFFGFFNYFLQYRNMIPIILMFYLFFITLYSYIKKNLQAKLIIFGWSVILLAGLIMYLSNIGILNIDISSYYIVEISFVLEALVFSIALANRIKILQEEKNVIQAKLICEQKDNEEKLNKLVVLKTTNLNNALEEKDILLRELNHRVKNNMQTIISLIRLQNDGIDDITINNLLTTIQNRISAMSYLHELLYQKDTITFIDANEYFERIIYEVQQSFYKDININCNINSTINSESAIYCGLIINELVTNSFKHAFTNNKSGLINIDFYNKNNEYYLYYNDNGKGYEPLEKNESLGLILIETLAKKQLKASLDIDSKDGVNVKIKWRD
jgi:two-component system, sensor histidine kinase LadS